MCCFADHIKAKLHLIAIGGTFPRWPSIHEVSKPLARFQHGPIPVRARLLVGLSRCAGGSNGN
jgi:hypothetical protein